MEWVHCNNCFAQPGIPDNRKFLLSNCGHIFCAKCKSGTSSNCTVCQRDSSSIVIEAGMTEEISNYFSDPEKTIAEQVKIFEFQKSHRLKLVKHLQEKAEKYRQQLQQAKDENKRHRDEKNKIKDELIQLSSELRRAKKEIATLENNSSSRAINSSTGPHKSLFSLCVNNKPTSSASNQSEFRIFGTQLQNQPFLQRSASSRDINFRQLNDTSSSPTMPREHLFTPPTPVPYQHAYRNHLVKSPDFYSPPSSETPPQRNIPTHRKVPLPGDKGSITPIGLARMSLQTPLTHGTNPSRKIGVTPTQRGVSKITPNKYDKYF